MSEIKIISLLNLIKDGIIIIPKVPEADLSKKWIGWI
jgi:hypothetical protein